MYYKPYKLPLYQLIV